MISRFRNIPQPLDPTLYTYQPQEYIPDLGAIGTVTTALQGIYDKLDYLDIPKHMQHDVADVRSRYIEPVEQLKEQAVNAFVEGDTGSGIRAIKDVQRFLHQAKQPGGVYTQFEQSYDAYQNYRTQLDKLYQDKKIGADRKDMLEKLSLSRFKGSFQGDTFSPFSGISAAFEQDRLAKGLEIGKGWKADKYPEGIYKGPNGYYDFRTKKQVSSKEVLDAVYNGLMSNPAIMEDLRQEAMLSGLTGEEAVTYINDQLKSVATTVANKEGFTEIDDQFLKDWMMQDQLAHSRRLKEIEFEYMLPQEQMTTGLIDIKVDGALPSLKDGKIEISKSSYRAFAPGAGSFKGGETVSQGFDQLLKSNPDYFKQYPGFDKVIDKLPRDVNGNDPESNEEYNKRVLEQYKRYREAHSTTLGYDLYNAKQGEDTKDKIFRKGKQTLGDVENRRVLLISPTGLKEVEFSELFNMADVGNDVEAFRERVSIYGEKSAASPGTPSGYLGSVTIPSKDKRTPKTIQFILTPDNKQNEKINTPMYELSSVEWMPDKFESEIVPYPFEDGVWMKTKKFLVEGEDGNLKPETRYYQVDYLPKRDREGNLIINPETGNPETQQVEIYMGPDAKQKLLLDLQMKNKMKPRELDTDVTMEPARRAKMTQQIPTWQN